MYSDIVTIYCKRDREFVPRVLRDVETQLGTAATVKTFGVDSGNNGVLIVPLKLQEGVMVTLPEKLKILKAKEWASTLNIDNAVYFGANECFMVCGDTSGIFGSFEQIKSAYDDVYLIASASCYHGTLPHLEVMLR